MSEPGFAAGLDDPAEAAAELRSRLRFERFFADVAARSVREPVTALASHVDEILRELTVVLDVDRCGLGLFSPDGRSLMVQHAYARAGVEHVGGSDLAAISPWYAAQLWQGRRLVLHSFADDLPPEAEEARRFAERTGLLSHAVVPLAAGDAVLGALGVGSVSRRRNWSPTLLSRLELLGGVLARALYRTRAEARLEEAEELNRAVLRVLPTGVIVVDGRGRVVAKNEAAEKGAPPSPDATVGEDYLAAVAARARGGSPEAAVEGLRAVLERRSASFETVLLLEGANGPRDHLLRAQPLASPDAMIVVHTDVTDLVRARTALEASLHEAAELKERLEAENVHLHREVRHAHGFETIVGRSAALGRVLAQVEQVAPTESPVLLLGETGTGKDIVARALHDRSGRRRRTFVSVNCAALPATLIESELFGHERGAFTGALERSPGRFEIADEGTIFLDEIGELPLEVQAKLLRVLQSGEFERLGSPRPLRTDARVIAATNRDLARETREGRFRADLYYRLSVFPVSLPPLRDRPEDIPLLVWHFVAAKQARLGKSIKRIPDRLMRTLTSYAWPGNVRELENVIERALILSAGPTLAADPLLSSVTGGETRGPAGGSLEDVQRAHIRSVLVECGWKVAGPGNAADRLGLNRSTLQFRMQKLGIRRPGPDGD